MTELTWHDLGELLQRIETGDKTAQEPLENYAKEAGYSNSESMLKDISRQLKSASKEILDQLEKIPGVIPILNRFIKLLESPDPGYRILAKNYAKFPITLLFRDAEEFNKEIAIAMPLPGINQKNSKKANGQPVTERRNIRDDARKRVALALLFLHDGRARTPTNAAKKAFSSKPTFNQYEHDEITLKYLEEFKRDINYANKEYQRFMRQHSTKTTKTERE